MGEGKQVNTSSMCVMFAYMCMWQGDMRYKIFNLPFILHIEEEVIDAQLVSNHVDTPIKDVIQSLNVTCSMKRDHLGFFINIEFLTWVDSLFYVEYNGESFKSKY